MLCKICISEKYIYRRSIYIGEVYISEKQQNENALFVRSVNNDEFKIKLEIPEAWNLKSSLVNYFGGIRKRISNGEKKSAKIWNGLIL